MMAERPFPEPSQSLVLPAEAKSNNRGKARQRHGRQYVCTSSRFGHFERLEARARQFIGLCDVC
jgi:hypothetical protein